MLLHDSVADLETEVLRRRGWRCRTRLGKFVKGCYGKAENRACVIKRLEDKSGQNNQVAVACRILGGCLLTEAGVRQAAVSSRRAA